MATKKEEKIRAKREKIKALGTGFGIHEPVIDALNYTESLLKALNYYSVTNDSKEKRKWFLDYVGKKEAVKYKDADDFEFRSAGTIARLKLRDQYLSDKELNFLESEAKRIAAINPVVKVIVDDKPSKPVVTIQDRIAESASSHIAEFNAMIDEFITADIEPNFSGYLDANNVSGAVSKLIPQAFVKLWNEMQDLIEGNDKQLIEGYSHIKKTKIKKICKLIEEIEGACAQRAVSAKVARKPRVQKVKPPSIVAKNVKYMKEFTELGLTSVLPEKIIGATEAMVYNTKTKKIQIYRAINNGTLGIKGTVITGYEVASSGAKTMRKPEQVKEFATLTKRTFAQAFKALTTKESAVNGRINLDSIIVKVF